MKSTRSPLVVAAVLALVAPVVVTVGCDRHDPAGTAGGRASVVTAASSTVVVASASATASTKTSEADAELLKALENGAAPAPSGSSGPMVGVLVGTAQIFTGPAATKTTHLGYLRQGARVLADPNPIKGEGCEQGWFKLVPVGYVCGKSVTTDLDNPKVRLGVVPPKFENVLPYVYARNVSHGTPLYRSVPTRDEMGFYEPYLGWPTTIEKKTVVANSDAAPVADDPPPPPKKKHKKKKKKKKHHGSDEETPSVDTSAGGAPEAPPIASTASPTVAAATVSTALPFLPPPGSDPASSASAVASADAPPEPPKPWWKRKKEDGKTPDVTLAEMQSDADQLLVRRMASGFYVAVDRTFGKNGRLFYKTTQGLLAPADRMSVVAPPTLSGQEIDEAHAGNAVGFVLSKTCAKYEVDLDKKTVKPAEGTLSRYDRAFLTGKTFARGGKSFHETVDGYWMRDGDIDWTEPGAPPKDLAPGEKWVDVSLSHQTLVAFEGTRPVFATLVSTGRKGKDKEHNHETPTGTWRIREKHVAVTMDGDGAAAGDMPYSIEDVPFVMYFFESYALHGAFWHDNFGRQQSHGCVNLAPLDAKRIFFWSDPPIPPGWHGMNATTDSPGSRVVVHD